MHRSRPACEVMQRSCPACAHCALICTLFSLQAMEQPLQEQLVGFLLQHPGDFTVMGPQHAELGVRVPTISFVSSHR